MDNGRRLGDKVADQFREAVMGLNKENFPDSILDSLEKEVRECFEAKTSWKFGTERTLRLILDLITEIKILKKENKK